MEFCYILRLRLAGDKTISLNHLFYTERITCTVLQCPLKAGQRATSSPVLFLAVSEKAAQICM